MLLHFHLQGQGVGKFQFLQVGSFEFLLTLAASGWSSDDLRRWALAIQGRTHHHKAACAPADTLARICFALLRDGVDYGTARVNRQLARETCALPA
ncbi:MAG: hypothetical protein ACOY5V_06755 [Pseudomonadota bacterium]